MILAFIANWLPEHRTAIDRTYALDATYDDIESGHSCGSPSTLRSALASHPIKMIDMLFAATAAPAKNILDNPHESS